MEDSPVSLDKWLTALWMVVNCKNGVSSYEIHRALGVTQKTAWFEPIEAPVVEYKALTGKAA
jgi:hypothetical protein